MSDMRTSSCKLSEINFADRTFPFSYGLLPACLETSISAVGLLQPPLLVAGETGYRIVCGRRRLEIIRKSADDTEKIPVCLAENCSLKELFRRALWDNLAIREFNLVETADIYIAALLYFSEDEIEKEVMPALKLPLRRRFRRRCQTIVDFPRSLRNLLAAGSMDGETVDLIREWSDDERSALVDLIVESGLRRNKLREVGGRFDDLARRDQVSPLEFIAAARSAALGEDGVLPFDPTGRRIPWPLL